MTFRFRPGLTAATLIAFAILVSLGTWQLHRRTWKLDLIAKTQARIEAAPIPFDEAYARAEAGEDMEYVPVRITGAFDHAAEAHVFGSYEARAGVYVFTPLSRGARAVYVNRGFAPQALSDKETRSDGLVEGPLTVDGLFRVGAGPQGLAALFAPQDQPADNMWFARDPARFAAATGVETGAYYVDSFGRENPGRWPQGGTTRLDFHNRHLSYAFTWFGLAATLIGVFLARSRATD